MEAAVGVKGPSAVNNCLMFPRAMYFYRETKDKGSLFAITAFHKLKCDSAGKLLKIPSCINFTTSKFTGKVNYMGLSK